MANLIYDNTISSATTQVDIDLTSTPIEKGELYELVYTFKSSTNSVYDIFANDDSANTSYTQQLFASGSATPSGTRFSGDEFASLTSTNQGLTFGRAYLKLTNGGNLVVLSSYMYDMVSNLGIVKRNVSTIDTYSNVTKLSIVAGTTNGIGINSRIQLYKVAEKVQDIEITSATTQQDITVDIQKGNEYLLVSDLVNAHAGDINVKIRFNNDTVDTNYDAQTLIANNTSVSGARDNYGFLIPASTSEKTLNIASIKLANSSLVNYQSSSIRAYGGSTPILYKSNGSYSNVLTSISTIALVISTANAINIGSRFELYKLV